MQKNILKLTAIFGFTIILLNSCGPKDNPPLVYFPDMYFPVAYDPLMKAKDAYSNKDNEIPAFVKANGATGLYPVNGTIAQNKDGVVEENSSKVMTPDQYNAGYDASKAILTTPLNTANQAKDLEKGKVLFERTCAACHGNLGDGQGTMVLTGAYAGVPKYADRLITVGSVHYVLTNGRNAMGSFAGQLNPGDRWRVAMYVMNAFKGGVNSPAAAAPLTTLPTTTVVANPTTNQATSATATNVTTTPKK